MSSTVAGQCRACIATLKRILSAISASEQSTAQVSHYQVNEELERLSLWIGNIGALHNPESLMSLETRLLEAGDILSHIRDLLGDLNEVADELLKIVSGQREGQVDVKTLRYSDDILDEGETEVINEESELLGEIRSCVSRLTRVSSLIRQAAPSDRFRKALSRNRYRFNDQFDIAHVGEKFPKLAAESVWLQNRLGRAITERRHYLSYIQNHHNKLEGIPAHAEQQEPISRTPQAPIIPQHPDSTSHPSTFVTKASTLNPSHVTHHMLTGDDGSDGDNDARSYTTLARSIDVDVDSAKIPKLDELKKGTRKEIECPFCFRTKKFKNEHVWRRHVFSDLRSYVCTFPECNAPYFGDVNAWFQHEMQNHRVSYLCKLCKNKSFLLKEQYLSHMKRQHLDLWEDGQEQLLLDIARKPLEQILARDCPCCSDWVDRLKERNLATGLPTHTSTADLAVVLPIDFKHHLASHLEQLALFAVPICAPSLNEIDSNVAIEEGLEEPDKRSTQTTLTFDSLEYLDKMYEERGVPIDRQYLASLVQEEEVKLRIELEWGLSIVWPDALSLSNEPQLKYPVIIYGRKDHITAATEQLHIKEQEFLESRTKSLDETNSVSANSHRVVGRPPFIFKIDEIGEDPNSSCQYDHFGHWIPSTDAGTNRRVGGGISDIFWFCNTHQILELPQVPAQALEYRQYSVYFEGGFGFWVLRGDATEPSIGESWQPLRFDHDDEDYSSFLTNVGTHKQLRTQRSDQLWPRMLLPDIYHAPVQTHTQNYGGLTGELPIFLALLALSMHRDRLYNILPSLFIGGSWAVHGYDFPRQPQRGVVVTVYTSPANWSGGSTFIDLEAYERGDYGKYFN